ncbi:MAG: 2-oxoglutarate dehydrogenase E1 component, partial [Rhodospirillales bacterium]|nr:2-oxoglutarate dehydrogenase E1 component [Rhodospirillales bacterium]
MGNSSEKLSFLASGNGAFVEELYSRYAEDHGSVDPDWAQFFAELADEAPAVVNGLKGPSWSPRSTRVIADDEPAPALIESAPVGPETISSEVRSATLDSVQALMLIRSHRVRGHLYCDLDPLGIEQPAPHTELDPESYGFTAADYDRDIYVHGILGFEKAPLRQIVDKLRRTYCGNIGVEYMHITSAEEKIWIQGRIESGQNNTDFTDRGKTEILTRLTEAEGLERFIHVKYPGTKRFGLDGGEALMPALEQILKRGSQLGVEEAVIGMPHRGRLNVLAHLLN